MGPFVLALAALAAPHHDPPMTPLHDGATFVVGAPAPEIALPVVAGARLSGLSELRGAPTVVFAVTPGDEASRARLKRAAELAWSRKVRDEAPLHFAAVVRERDASRAQGLGAWLEAKFPQFWDPFLTVAPEVDSFCVLIDAMGYVRATGLDLSDGEALLAALAAAAAAAEGAAPAPVGEPYLAPALARVRIAHPPGSEAEARAALSNILWLSGDRSAAGSAFDGALAALDRRAAAPDARPIERWRAGTARWIRRGSPFAAPGDGEAAVAHWRAAVGACVEDAALTRPLRELGPRLAKREAAYAWLDAARAALAAQGSTLGAWRVPPSRAELVGPSPELPRLAEAELAPDPDNAVERDEGGVLVLDGVCVPNIDLAVSSAADPNAKAGGPRDVRTARVHLSVALAEGALFDPEAPAPRAWLVVPQGWGIDRNAYELPRSEADPTKGALHVDFELLAPLAKDGAAAPTPTGAVRGYVLAHVFDREGRRRHLRKEVNLRVDLR